MTAYTKQNDLLLNNLTEFYKTNDYHHLKEMLSVLNGESKISLRIIDWFVTNYAKKNYVVYDLPNQYRFKVHNDYKLKLKAYSKRIFDPFQRWERIVIPFGANQELETTIGQLNFFKWSIENGILEYIDQHFEDIETDMNQRNSLAKRRTVPVGTPAESAKTRKKREELSVSACKCIKKEYVKIVVKF